MGGRAPCATPRAWSRLGLEKAPAGARLHAVAEEGVPSREIAQAIGRALGLPVASIAADDVQDHFGWIGMFFAMDLAASSAAPGSCSAGARGADPDRGHRRRRLRARCFAGPVARLRGRQRQARGPAG